MSEELKYNSDQRREYLEMIDRIGGRWLGVFDGKELFYSAQYWDLFTRIWRSDRSVTKTEALRCMTGIKSAHTAGKYLETALKEGLLVEQDNPDDKRSRFIALSPEMQSRLDVFFDRAVSEVRRTNHTIHVKGPSPEEP
ncbi:MAG: hypothetical protein AAF495_14730 [Pseudomonadota bacterium]